MFPTNSISFLFIFLNFIGTSLCAPSYQWDLTNSTRNVQTFAKFIDKLYAEYSTIDKMDQNLLPNPFPDGYSDKQKRTVFNFTFAKCVAEIAHFRVISDRPLRNLNVAIEDKEKFVGFWHYDKSLGDQIVNAFEKEIFGPAKEQKIAKTVENQIMQLAFSFAVRVLLCVIYENYNYQTDQVREWQLHMLLSAFQILKDANIENGIFPYQIIQIDNNGNHLWKQKLYYAEDNSETSAQKQKRYIENFNFTLRLSNFKLTRNEIVEVLDRIMGKNDQQTPPTIYTFMDDHFRSSLSPKKGIINKLMDNRWQCAMVAFGRELQKRFRWHYVKFRNYSHEMVEKCGGSDVHQEKLPPNINRQLFIADNNTPKKNSNQIVLEIFDEPLWNYVGAIKVDSNINKARKQFCVELRKLIISKKSLLKNVPKTKKFQLLLQSFEHKGDFLDQIKNWSRKFEEHLKDRSNALKNIEIILDEILAEYDKANSIQLYEQLNVPFKKEIHKFGLIFYETLRKYNGEDKVRYDEEGQLLTFPMEIWEHLISRLCTFVKKNLTTSTKVGDDIDIVSAMDAIASSSTEDNLASKKRIKLFGLTKKENKSIFRWLFTMALRLCRQMESKNDFDAKNYLSILSVHLPLFKKDRGYLRDIFDYKINVEQKLVRINLPNWQIPYKVYLEKENELIDAKAKSISILYNWLPKLKMSSLLENYAYINAQLTTFKKDEWNLLEKGLMENGQSGDNEWEEVMKLLDQLNKELIKKTYSNQDNLKKMMKEIIGKFENFKNKLEENEGIGRKTK